MNSKADSVPLLVALVLLTLGSTSSFQSPLAPPTTSICAWRCDPQHRYMSSLLVEEAMASSDQPMAPTRMLGLLSGQHFQRIRKIGFPINFGSTMIASSEEHAEADVAEETTKDSDRLASFESRLKTAMLSSTENNINEIALDYVKLLYGHWDVTIGVDTHVETRALVAESRNELRITKRIDGSNYPLRVENEVFLGPTSVIQSQGKLEFDLLDHTAKFNMGELVVLGVNVDVDALTREAEEELERQIARTVNDGLMKETGWA